MCNIDSVEYYIQFVEAYLPLWEKIMMMIICQQIKDTCAKVHQRNRCGEKQKERKNWKVIDFTPFDVWAQRIGIDLNNLSTLF